jgi:ribosomal protein S18 acetylase RimI-like enzyme
MPTRRATWSDLLPASKILAEAFHDDYLFGDFIHPRRTEFSDDVYLYWLRFLREVYYTEPGEYLVVSYQEANNNNDNDKENNSPELEQNQQQQQNQTITGIAHWIRNHSTPPPTPWPSQLALKATETYNKLENLYWPNRALSKSHDAILPLGNPFFAHHWSGSRADSWHLSILGVSPEYGGQGYGRSLVAWGFERSLREAVSCSVISVPGQEGFYRVCGFDRVVGTTNDEGGEGNAWRKAGIEASTIMFCDHGVEPSGLRGFGEG